jgi:RNA polymerase sigma-70 factor, ECF subfamily
MSLMTRGPGERKGHDAGRELMASPRGTAVPPGWHHRGRDRQSRYRANRTGHGELDESFVKLLYTEYASLLLLVTLRLTGGDRHWAEDVVQETLVRAWQHASQLLRERRSRNLMPWLVTVARRIVINDWRARGARPQEVDDSVLRLVVVPDDTDRVLQRLVLQEALGALSAMHRRVVVEMFLRGRSVREVARIVGIPPGTVKSRVFNALRVMRATMLARGFGSSRGGDA